MNYHAHNVISIFEAPQSGQTQTTQAKIDSLSAEFSSCAAGFDALEAEKRERERRETERGREAWREKTKQKSMVVDFYKVLEVNRRATESEIKKQFRKLAIRYHPDKQKGGGDVALATQMFHGITEAYQVLSDKQRRAEYDADLELKKSTMFSTGKGVDTTLLKTNSDEFIGDLHDLNHVLFSPDGTKVATAYTLKKVKLWDVTSGECLRTLEGHSYAVLSVSFSPDGSKLASGSSDNTVKLWDVMSGKLLKTLEHSECVHCVSFSPDGTKVASGSGYRDDGENAVTLWDVTSGECLWTLAGHSDWVRSVSFSPDGTKVVTGSDDATVKLWDVTSGECLQTLEGHSSRVCSVSFSPDGTKVASTSFDNTKLWDVGSETSGECLKTMDHGGDEVRFCTRSRKTGSVFDFVVICGNTFYTYIS